MKRFGIRTPQKVTSIIRTGRPYVWRLLLAAVLLLGAGILLYMQLPAQTTYAWGAKNCVSQPTALPNLQNVRAENVSITQESFVTLFGYPVLSRSTCFAVDSVATGNQAITVKKSPKLLPFIAQTFHIEPEPYPAILSGEALPEPVPVNGEVQLLLNKPDIHFTYKLLINDMYSACDNSGVRLVCNIANQSLVHATQYSAAVVREFKTYQEPATTISFITVEPIQITSQSIAQGEKVVAKPTALTIATNKDIAEVTGVSLKAGETVYDTTATVQGGTVTVALPADLPRATTYTLGIAGMKGTRNETLPAPYQTTFYLMPGPKVTGMSIGDRAISPSASITVTFDQALATSAPAGLITLKQNGAPVEASITVKGTTAKITPKQPLARCAELQVGVNGKAENVHGVVNDVAWSAKSRVTCASSFSIGLSTEGRGIIGYSFGSGSREILYLGALHGDEGNTKTLLEKWMYELEGDPGRIPAGTTVVVIPLLNPDGYARKSRNNARGVDLNRNFASYNWKSDIVVQGGQTMPKGGGESPLSEPESRAIANYITRNRPAVIASYHSKGGIIESNEAGAANQIGKTYSSRSGYGYKELSTNVGFFNYDVNGSLEEWAKDKLGQPVILIELQTKTSDEFSRNRTAMWGLL